MILRKKSSILFIFLGVLLIISLINFLFFQKNKNSTSNITPEVSLLMDVAIWYPSAPWSEPEKTSEQTSYGNLSGESIQAEVESSSPILLHFENKEGLSKKGFTWDSSLSADGPDGSMWGYKKTENGKTQIMTISYKTKPTSSNPNEPLQFNCPCKMDVTAFVSYPF